MIEEAVRREQIKESDRTDVDNEAQKESQPIEMPHSPSISFRMKSFYHLSGTLEK